MYNPHEVKYINISKENYHLCIDYIVKLAWIKAKDANSEFLSSDHLLAAAEQLADNEEDENIKDFYKTYSKEMRELKGIGYAIQVPNN